MNKVFSAVVRYIKQTDRTLILFSILAAVYGVVVVYSATLYQNTGGIFSRKIIMQVIATTLGFVIMIVLSKIDYHHITALWKFIGVVCILLLIYLDINGKGQAGNKSWIMFGSQSIQPAEFIKVAFIITLAKHFDLVKDEISSPKNVLLLCLHGGVIIGLMVLTKDMGVALIFVAIFVSMLFATNMKLRYFVGAGIVVLIALPILWNKVFGSMQRNRILALFDPTNPQYKDIMLQQNQAKQALSSGMIWGYGLFKGPRTQSLSGGALSERENDMIFAAIGEELGLIGCLAVVVILSVILVRCLVDASHSKDSMGALICVGVFSMFSLQIVVNLGMALSILPVIGLTLPFFSAGGTSAVSNFFALGLVLSVYMHRKDLMFAGQNDT